MAIQRSTDGLLKKLFLTAASIHVEDSFRFCSRWRSTESAFSRLRETASAAPHRVTNGCSSELGMTGPGIVGRLREEGSFEWAAGKQHGASLRPALLQLCRGAIDQLRFALKHPRDLSDLGIYIRVALLFN